jgi:hypothetical protein
LNESDLTNLQSLLLFLNDVARDVQNAHDQANEENDGKLALEGGNERIVDKGWVGKALQSNVDSIEQLLSIWSEMDCDGNVDCSLECQEAFAPVAGLAAGGERSLSRSRRHFDPRKNVVGVPTFVHLESGALLLVRVRD